MNKYNTSIEKSLDIIEKNVLISSSDADGVLTQVSDALCDISGYSREELVGQNHNIFKNPDVQGNIFKDLWATISDGEKWQGEVKNKNKDDSFYWADVAITPDFSDSKELIGYTAIYKDITDKKLLEELAVTDPLTKIYNRRAVERSMQKELFRAQRYKTTFSIILLDIDMFKSINDMYGRDVGDITLATVAGILKDNIRNTDVLGRWGGEEFLIFCPETNVDQVQIAAEKLRVKVEEFSFKNSNKQTCSFGVSEYRSEDTGLDDVINRSDRALYEAKYSGRNRVVARTF